MRRGATLQTRRTARPATASAARARSQLVHAAAAAAARCDTETIVTTFFSFHAKIRSQNTTSLVTDIHFKTTYTVESARGAAPPRTNIRRPHHAAHRCPPPSPSLVVITFDPVRLTCRLQPPAPLPFAFSAFPEPPSKTYAVLPISSVRVSVRVSPPSPPPSTTWIARRSPDRG